MALLNTLTALTAADNAATDIVYAAVSPFDPASDRKQSRTDLFAQVPVPITAGKPGSITGAFGLYSANNTNLVQLTVDTPAAPLTYVLPNASPTVGQVLSASAPAANVVTLTWVAQTAATTPAGANTQIQFNNSGSFGASANLTWVSPTLTIGVASSVTGVLSLANSAGANVTSLRAGNAASALIFVLPVVDPTLGQVLSASAPAGSVVTLSWVAQTAATTPGGSDTQLQRNNAGAFGGISGATSNGTSVTFSSGNLLATSPRITTGINDAAGAPIILLSAVGSAVNQITISNNAAAVAAGPTVTTTGSDTDINLTVDLAGAGYMRYLGPHVLMNGGGASLNNLFYVGSDSAGAVDASFGFLVGGVGSQNANDGPYFLARGNNFSGASDSQRGSILFTAGNSTATATRGTIRFFTGAEVERFRITNNGFLFMACPNAAPTDADIPNGFLVIRANEAGSEFIFRFRDSGGTLRTGNLAYT